MRLLIWSATIILLAATVPAGVVDPPQDQEQQQDREESQTQDDAAQQAGDDETESDEPADEETVVTDAHRTVWTLMAQVAAKAGNLTEDQTARLVEIYVDARARYADAEDATRDEWKEELRRNLERQRAEGEVQGVVFDSTQIGLTIKLLLNRHRQRFAESLVKLLEMHTAEAIYPLLGGFDRNTDDLIHEIIGFELEDDSEFAAATAVQQYYIETVKAQQLPAGQVRGAADQARQNLLGQLGALLSDEQLQKMAKKIGVRVRS